MLIYETDMIIFVLCCLLFSSLSICFGEKETKWFVFLLELNKSRNRTHAGNFLNVFLFNLFIFKLYFSERSNCELGYSCNNQSTVVVYAGLHKDSSMFLEMD